LIHNCALRVLAARLQIATSLSSRGNAHAARLEYLGHEAKRDLLQRLPAGHDTSRRGDTQGSST
jgi:hypothetical protein